MGTHAGISISQFPAQGPLKGQRVAVSFNGLNGEIEGVVLRDDREEPFRTIIHLDDGRTLLGTECRYRPI
ncbi:hypothetical protein ACOTJQ_29160 [Achromobacter xylosoxidans]|uniref:hypothetical protein n=1 Tax=Achromobacter ruhlandii TaxID=72557 RepID=UPI003B9C6E55